MKISIKKYNFLALFMSTIILLSITNSCGTCKMEKEPFVLTQNTPFTVKNSYCQKWVAGIKEGGSGLNIYAIINDIPEGVTLKEFYFRGKSVDVKTSKDPIFVAYYKDDINKGVIMDNNPTNEAANIPPEISPFKLENNEAILSYDYNNKVYYHKILNIEEKQTIAYPSMAPDNKL